MSNLEPDHILKPNQVELDKVTTSEVSIGPIQNIAFICHADRPLSLLIGPIKITYYGISKLGKFFSKDEDRSFINIPLDPNQEHCLELKSLFKKFDNHYLSDDVKKALFGTKFNQYQYQPLVREKLSDECDIDSDDIESVPKLKLPPYCKVKFPIYESIIKTKIIKNGQRIKCDTMTDIANIVRYKSAPEFVIRFGKIWINKTRMPGCNKIPYGIGLLMEEVRIGRVYYPINIDKPIYHKDELRKKYADDINKIKQNITKIGKMIINV